MTINWLNLPQIRMVFTQNVNMCQGCIFNVPVTCYISVTITSVLQFCYGCGRYKNWIILYDTKHGFHFIPIRRKKEMMQLVLKDIN